MQSPALSTLDVLQDLRAQIRAAGFELIFECETESCGGFDFRFGAEVVAEPDMHVDLGDFRYLAADRGTDANKEYLSLLVSRSPQNGYVQLMRVGALLAPAADPTASQAPGAEPQAAAPPIVAPAAPDLVATGWTPAGRWRWRIWRLPRGPHPCRG